MNTTPGLQIDGALARITLRRPARANRLQPEDLLQLLAHIETVNAAAEVCVLQLQARGKTFCSGFEISAIGGGGEQLFEQVANALENTRAVTLALLHGGVYGGATDLALACDFRLGVPACEMFLPAARLGLVFYRGGLERLISRLGLNAAKRILLGAERLDADEMKATGFLTHLVAADALPAAAQQLTQTLSALAPLALLPMKQQLNQIARGTLDADALQRAQQQAAHSADLQEGKTAWAARRAPRFSGR